MLFLDLITCYEKRKHHEKLNEILGRIESYLIYKKYNMIFRLFKKGVKAISPSLTKNKKTMLSHGRLT